MPATYECIATTTLNSSASSVTFSSISGSYTDLRVVARFTSASSSTFGDAVQFNNDTGTSYAFIQTGVRFPGGTAGFHSVTDSNTNYIWGAFGQNSNGPTSIYDIYDYSNTTTFKTVWSSSISWTGEVEGPYPSYNCGHWRSTSAITTITFMKGAGSGTQYASGSVFTLYGIKKA